MIAIRDVSRRRDEFPECTGKRSEYMSRMAGKQGGDGLVSTARWNPIMKRAWCQLSRRGDCASRVRSRRRFASPECQWLPANTCRQHLQTAIVLEGESGERGGETNGLVFGPHPDRIAPVTVEQARIAAWRLAPPGEGQRSGCATELRRLRQRCARAPAGRGIAA